MPIEQRRELVRSWLELTVKNLVDYPQVVEISHFIGEQTTVFFVKVSPPDVGKVIGKVGTTAKAIRELMAKMAVNFDFRCVMDIKN